MKLIVAPIQGHTNAAFRHFHAMTYGTADEYVAPFIHIEHGEPRRRDMRDITSPLNAGLPVRPQILFKNVEEFQLLVNAVKEAGYHTVDLNLGCPFPPQMRRGRGSAMISNVECMAQVTDLISADPSMDYSIKMRLGAVHPHEWEQLMPLINRAPLSRLVIHPRLATEQYSGRVNIDEFRRIVDASVHPMVYNGDVTSADDIHSIVTQFPSLSGIMMGRGLLSRPSLIEEWRGSREWTRAERIQRLITFHNSILGHYEATLCGEAQILSHIKPFWEYSEGEIGHKPLKLIKKATSLTAYRAVVDTLSAGL